MAANMKSGATDYTKEEGNEYEWEQASSGNSDLLSCPFCGGAGVVARGRGSQYKIECENRNTTCPVNMRTHYHDIRGRAVRQWNTRAR